MYCYANIHQNKLTIIIISIALALTTVGLLSSCIISAEKHIKQRSIQRVNK